MSQGESPKKEDIKIYVGRKGGRAGQYSLLSEGPAEFFFSTVVSDGTVAQEISDFNLACSGVKEIDRVTYKGENCSFVKQVFFTPEQKEQGEAGEDLVGPLVGLYPEGSTGGSTDQIEIYYGYTPIGDVYSVDYETSRALSHFGILIRYEVQNDRDKARAEAYNKAGILVELQMKDGSKLTKRIRFQGIYQERAFFAKEAE